MLSLTLGILFMTGSFVFANSQLDLEHWENERISLSNLELVFQVPGGQSEAAPPRPTIRRIDLERDFTKEKTGFPIYDHTWEFDVGIFKGTMGSLNLIVAIATRPNDYAAEFTSLDNLQPLIARQLERTYAETNEKLRRQGNEKLAARMPETYNHVNIRGHAWLVYSLGGWFDRTFYATPLTKNHYLRFIFNFADNTRGYKSNWRQQAQDVADKIMGSIEIRENK